MAAISRAARSRLRRRSASSASMAARRGVRQRSSISAKAVTQGINQQLAQVREALANLPTSP